MQLILASDHSLHPTHATCMRLKSHLIAAFGYAPGRLYHQMDDQQVQRKIGLCQEFLQVCGAVDPGG